MNIVAANVRRFREARQWTQEEFTCVAGIDARTVQRAESGSPLSLETRKAIAAAFDVTIEMLATPLEEVRRQLEEFQSKFELVNLEAPARSSDLGQMFSNADAHCVHPAGALTEAQLNEIAEFEQLASDYGAVWDDLESFMRRDAEGLLFRQVELLKSTGVSVSIGFERLLFRNEAGMTVPLRMCHAVALAGDAALGVLPLEKGRAISFC